MKENLNKTKQSVENLKKAATIITLISIIYSSYVLYEKYHDLKLEFDSSVRQRLFDKYFCCDYWGDVSNEIDQRAYENHFNDSIEDFIIDAWIKRDMSEMGAMDTSLYNYYWENNDRSLIRDRIINYRIKKEQDIEQEKERQKEDSITIERSNIIEKEAEIQTANENIISHIPLAYVLGVLGSTLVLPLVFWLFFYLRTIQLKKLIDLEK
jgi:hypothetical protein